MLTHLSLFYFHSILTFYDRYNGTILGFVYDAQEAPQPQPVIKGAASRRNAGALSLVLASLASLIFLV